MNKPSVPHIPSAGPHVLIVGGGASGVLMAAHLLRQPGAGFRVTIIEGRNMLGCGVAYSTTDPDHLLNTRVHNMSAFADRPDHFRDWLQARGGAEVSPACFVDRGTYGAYLTELPAGWTSGSEARRTTCIRDSCVGIKEGPGTVTAHLAGGRRVTGAIAILAAGHVLPRGGPGSVLSGAWDAADAVDPEDRILIVGTRLSMVDQVLSLLKSGHRGEILSVSRRGRLPRPHAATVPLKIAVEEIPQGATVSRLPAWARGLARRTEEQGGTWRDAVDGIRPHVLSGDGVVFLSRQASRAVRSAPSAGELVMHEIERPACVGPRLDQDRGPCAKRLAARFAFTDGSPPHRRAGRCG